MNGENRPSGGTAPRAGRRAGRRTALIAGGTASTSLRAAGGGLAALLAACAAPGGERAQGEGQSTGTLPATVRWTDDNSEFSRAFSEEFARRFMEKHPRITPTMEVFAGGSWKERSEKYTTMAIAGEMPEVVWFSATFLRPALMKGFVRELDPFIKRDWKQAEIDDFYKGPYEGMKIEGKQMAIPVTINNNLIYVNLNHLKEANLPYPGESWTREQLLDYAQKLGKRGAGATWRPGRGA